MKKPEPVQVVKQRRDAALRALVDGIPYIQYLGMTFDRRGDELTGVLPFDEKLIGNPLLPALHGGVTAAFLEVTAVMTLTWAYLWEDIEKGTLDFDPGAETRMPRVPKTVDFSVRNQPGINRMDQNSKKFVPRSSSHVTNERRKRSING